MGDARDRREYDGVLDGCRTGCVRRCSHSVGIVVLVAVGLIGVSTAWFSRGRIAPALALTRRLLSWLAVGRLVREPESTGIGITAILTPMAVLLATIIGRFARGRVPTS